MALTKHFKKILKNSTFSIVSDPSHSYCMVEYYTGFGDTRKCETYYVLKSVLLPVLEQTKSVKTLLAVAIENRLLGSDDTRLTQIPPATTTDNKSDLQGVVESVGDAPLASDSSDLPYPPSVEGIGSGVNPHSPVQLPISAVVDTPLHKTIIQKAEPYNGQGVIIERPFSACPYLLVWLYQVVKGVRQPITERLIVPATLAAKLSIYEYPRQIIKVCREHIVSDPKLQALFDDPATFMHTEGNLLE